MGKFVLLIAFLFLSLTAVGIADDSFALSLKDICPTMDKMLSYHVENREFSPRIARRSLKIYIEQFDPQRIYLFKEEVDLHLEMPTKQIKKVAAHYKKGKFPLYCALNTAIQKAIQRAQKIRREEMERLIEQGGLALNENIPSHYTDYPRGEKELRSRIRGYLISAVQAHLCLHKKSSPSPLLVKRILNYQSKKFASYEREYLTGGEHFLTLHILKAMAKSLDAHTGYYSPREAYELRTMLQKEFSGVGIVFREDLDGIYVKDLLQNGPADRDGNIQRGDLLIAVDHKSIEQISFKNFLDKIKGEDGSKVTLTVQRKEVTIQVDLVREKISMDSERITFSHEPHGEGVIGKVTVPSFYDNGKSISASRDFREAVRALKEEGNLHGLILDFRRNSGGFLGQAIKFASLFVNGGLIVVSKYAGEEVRYARAIDGRQLFSGPVIVLISKISASAAEIVAQTLQDHGVAIVVGDERSYGKGSMQLQTLTDEKAKAFFKVTVGRYYTASGRSPQILGVRGDILVPTAFFPYNIGEKYLEFPLANDHLSGEVFHSLLSIGQGSYGDIAPFALSHLKPRLSHWRRMLPHLVQNSRIRIAKSNNYQFFLEAGKGISPQKERKKSQNRAQNKNCGVNDLQIQESVEILKDMIALDRQKSLQ